jgi:tetratricopeptide (TPR) repeat protein
MEPSSRQIRTELKAFKKSTEVNHESPETLACWDRAVASGPGCLYQPSDAATAKQESKPSADAELKLVSDMIEVAGNDITRYRKAGGKLSDSDNPARKWADVLWQYHEVHPGTPASIKAATMALRGFGQTGQVDTIIAKAETFKAEDPAWEQVGGFLLYAASKKKDYGLFIKKVESVLERASDKKARAALWLSLGEAYQKQNNIERAKSAFEAVGRESPESDYAKNAKGNLHEVTHLNVGQAAPQFVAKTMNGATISPADLKGKVVLLNFWATW